MSNPQHEPTMEEILASIRKIISEDTPEATAPVEAAHQPAPAPEPVMDTMMEDDVLELTQEVPAEPEPIELMPVAPAPMPPPPSAPEPILAAAPQEQDVEFQSVEEPAPPPPAPEPAPASHEGIFSDRTRSAMEETFAKIPAIAPEPKQREAAPDVFGPSHGPTLESVFEKAVAESFEPVLRRYLHDNASGIIEGMKPVIREWMDEHFPALLEGAVRAEAERVARSHIKR